MPYFFKVGKDHRKVYVLKTPKEEITEEEFLKKCKCIFVNEWKNIPFEVIAIIEWKKQIEEMRLSKIGAVLITDENGKRIQKDYHIGNCVFSEDLTKYEGRFTMQHAVWHGELIYGELFMKDNGSMLNDGKMHYMSGWVEIGEEKYNKILEWDKQLSSIVKVEMKNFDIKPRKKVVERKLFK